jgi:hypothetical protein
VGGLIVVAIFLFVSGLLILSGRKQAQQVADLTTTGILGRAIILQADRNSSRTTVNGQRMEQRAVLLDIELPGQQPYEMSLSAAIPRIVEALPGSSVDVRVDPKDPSNVMIVGPAGSSAWLASTNNLLLQPAGIPTSTGTPAGCGVTLIVAAVVCAGIAVGIGLNDGKSSESKPKGGICAAAERCCDAAGGAACSGYKKGSESSCETAYEKYKTKASKLHKKCD